MGSYWFVCSADFPIADLRLLINGLYVQRDWAIGFIFVCLIVPTCQGYKQIQNDVDIKFFILMTSRKVFEYIFSERDQENFHLTYRLVATSVISQSAIFGTPFSKISNMFTI
ncbi:hypothetical protein AMTRI_Chr04g245340 [Amborella trichopoda]